MGKIKTCLWGVHKWEEMGLAKLASKPSPDGLWKSQIFEGRLRSSDLSPLESDKQPGICGIYQLFILQIFLQF